MPIGTIDYVSTVPWNDAFNPWPQYAQVIVSAYDIQGGAALTYTLTQFDPAASHVFYSAGTAEGNYLAYGAGTWYVIAQEELNYYTLATTTRAIPAGWVQGNTNWMPDNGQFEDTLSITAVTTVLTPWEFRRRRLLELC